MKNIHAVTDKVVVKVNLKDKQTEGGLIIPEIVESQVPQRYGEVISVGPDVLQIKESQTIMFHERAGMDIILDKQLYKVIKNEEVYAIISNGEI